MNNPGGAFGYVFTVPTDPRSPMQGRIWNPSSHPKCSLGQTPVLAWAEYTPEPWKLYATVTLTPSHKRGAAEKTAALTIDRGLLTVLRQGR
jgi:hypothetical protein